MKTLVMVSGLALAVAGCGGAKAEGGGEPKTAANENAPPPPSDEKIQQHQKEEAAEAPPAGNPQAKQAAKKIAADERADFDAAFAKWEAAKKAGTAQQDCKSLASAFESVARGHKTLASQALFNAGTLLDQCGDEKGAEDQYKQALEAN